MIWGIKDGKAEIQALRYPKDIWTASAAKTHCDSRGGTFEAASGGKMNNKAYSVLELKSVDEDRRIIEGIATTPAPDRMEDVVEPEGIQFSLPFPFLYQHNARQPIGMVTDAKVNKAGMRIKATLAPKGTAPFIDEAWSLIKAGLIRGLSIGFRSLEEAYDKTTGGFHYLKSELLEISAVTIPANAEANITAIKSADVSPPAALGHGRKASSGSAKQITPGVSGTKRQDNMRTIGEQIAALEAKRQANVARKEALRLGAAEEGRVMDVAEAEEFDGLDVDNEAIDKELARLQRHQKQIENAVPITEATAGSTDAGSAVRGLITIPRNREPLKPGTRFTRYAMALMKSRGNLPQAYELAKAWKDTPEVASVLKAAVDAGTTTDAGWAAELADYRYMASEFIEFLRPMTIIGRIPGLRGVPFNIRIPLQDAGSSVNWVGEGCAKPVSKLNFDTATLRFAKAAGIVVTTEELLRFSNPAAEGLVRQDLAAAIRQFLDEQFVDPTVAAVPNVSPASITNGAAFQAATGTTAADFRADFQAAITAIITANIDPTGIVIIMQPTLAVAMSLMRNALGQKEFPDISAEGGRLEGYAVVTSMSVPAGVVIFLKPNEILLADEGGITLDASREATITMDDGTSPASTTTVSMWQNNMVALRVERYIYWARRRDEAVFYITGAGYGSTSP